MAETADNEGHESAPNTVTELRALEWELDDVIRRLEVLREQLHDLHVSQPSGKSDEPSEPGSL